MLALRKSTNSEHQIGSEKKLTNPIISSGKLLNLTEPSIGDNPSSYAQSNIDNSTLHSRLSYVHDPSHLTASVARLKVARAMKRAYNSVIVDLVFLG